MPPSDKRYSVADLPGEIALFPLREALLLPRGRLPLNVFEPRYLSMVDYALAHGRMVGLVRPQYDGDDEVNPPLYEVGCAGRIVSFAETGSGRLVLSLDGVSRFRLIRDTLSDAGFRVGAVEFAPFARDLTPSTYEDDFVRNRIINVLGAYLSAIDLSADWDSVDGAPIEAIISGIAMACPFDPDEKQALLEAPDVPSRAETLITTMEMAIAAEGMDGGSPPERLQ
ncbi:MAG: LON peptidase substrate-binding domain-containing protein [Parvularcula sp.]